MTIDFICGVLAELFDSPCNFSPMDEYMFQDKYCESHCGEVADKDCWKRYFEKRWADRKTEPSDSEKPNNCEWGVEYAKEMLNTMPCEECGHWEHGAGDHYYCALLEMGQQCYFESKNESTLMFANILQTERSK